MTRKLFNNLMASTALAVLFAASSVHGGGAASGGSRFEPQVAMMCHGRSEYLAQYQDAKGEWRTNTAPAKITCLKDKLDILHYCKQMYRDRDITNIVESSHYQQVPNFCRVGHTKCKTTFWVKPYRCLEGQFQSDALLVPEGCMFDHIHNQSRCWQFDRWNATADEACKARKPSLHLKSFAMLLPCGIDVFSGVEFVCCPKTYKGHGQVRTQQVEEPLALPSVDHRAPAPAPSSSAAPSTMHARPTTAPQEVGTRDSYFSRFDPHEEHDAFRKAEQRLEERHRDKVSKILKEWSELEARYLELKKTDPHGAEQFKERMTRRFQATVDAVEAENEAEKHQLSALHQQRVVAHINEMKREAMTCYTRALRETLPNTHKVQKCLQKLLRSLNKDRHHTVSHYKHLLNTDYRAAERERDSTLQHLSDLDRMTNQSLQMLQRHRELYIKMGPLMHEYASSLRKKDTTPAELSPDSSFLLSQEEDEGSEGETRSDDYDEEETDDDDSADDAEYDEEDEDGSLSDEANDQKVEDDSVETESDYNPVSADSRATSTSSTEAAPPASPITKLEEPEAVEDNTHASYGLPPHVEVSSSSSSSDEAHVNSTADEPLVMTHQQDVPLAAHAQHHALAHEQTGYSVRHDTTTSSSSESRGVYFTLAFAGVALMAAMVVGIVVLRRRAVRHPSQQGFMEVDQNATVITPEERHVANMQVNGYENPTYKFFEEK